MDAFQLWADRLAAPPLLYSLALLLFLATVRWRALRSRAAGLALAGALLAVLAAGLLDAGFRRLALAPERLPVAALAIPSLCLLWLAIRRGPAVDPRAWRGPSPAETGAVVAAGLLLMALALTLPPPLAAPGAAAPPNPARAPWFLAGLQEMRLYFDPWVTSYLIPSLLLAALLALPYLDPGSAVPADADAAAARRPGAPRIFLLGWLLLAILPILVAAFLRGPHWNVFGPFEAWDAARPAPPPAPPLSEVFWCGWLGREMPPAHWPARELPGILILALYFLVLPRGLHRWGATRGIFGRYHRAVGPRRYYLALILALALATVPLKMYGRWILGVGYWLYLPELPLNF